MTTQRTPLFFIDDTPVFRGDRLFHSDLKRTGGIVHAEFMPEGGDVTVRSLNGAVPRVRTDELTLKPKANDLLRHTFQLHCRQHGITDTSERDFTMWKIGREHVEEVTEDNYIKAVLNRWNTNEKSLKERESS
tara:strand:+ start:298 stop:696 length:399 start_codon:yes stop_codon:yes gene_type:complete